MNSGMIPRRTNQTESPESRTESVGAEGSAVVGPDSLGEAVLAEELEEDGPGSSDRGIRQTLTGDDRFPLLGGGADYFLRTALTKCRQMCYRLSTTTMRL